MVRISPVLSSMRSTAFHSYHPSAGIRQREYLKDCRHITLAAASSDLALKQCWGGFGSFHQVGTKPQRASISSSSPVAGLPRISGIAVVGATLKWREKGLLFIRPMCQARSIEAVSGLT